MRPFLLAAALLLSALAGARAEVLRIARQPGLSYVPLMVMQERGLIEAEARARGVELSVEWQVFTGGPPINDALISGNIDVAVGGVGPMLTLWARTRSSLKVRGLATLGAMPMWLMTSNPNARSIQDLGPGDRIALPGVKVSVQAVVLQMAAQQAFGPGEQNRLDPLTVSMGHPDGLAALMGGGSEITAHFTSAPFMYQEAADPRIHRLLNSYDVLGGPHTFNVVWATTRFHDAHPQAVAAFVAALDKALAVVRDDPDAAAATWLRVEKGRLPQADVSAMLRRPENEWTMAPRRMMRFMDFMAAAGAINARAADWRELFFPIAHGLDGS